MPPLPDLIQTRPWPQSSHSSDRKIRGKVYTDGGPVVCRFDDGMLVVGHVHFCPDSDRMWLCHDIRQRDGNPSPDRLGHRYSWSFGYDSFSDEFTDQITGMWPINGEYAQKQSCLSNELRCFLATQPIGNELMAFFSISMKPFEAFSEFGLSEKPGNIVMSGTVTTPKGVFRKMCEIRLSRYVARMSESLGKAGIDLGVKDKHVEELHNSLVAYQSGEYFEMEYLSGKDIKQAYKVKNYSKGTIGTIHKSCMNGKGSMLDLYTKNPSVVRLAVLRSEHGIEARCLVWNSGGKQYFDRVYYTHEWAKNILEDKLRAEGCKSIQLSRTLKHVELEVSDFEEYPYVDSFRFLSQSDGRLYFLPVESCAGDLGLPAGKYRRLCHTDGSYMTVRFDGHDITIVTA